MVYLGKCAMYIQKECEYCHFRWNILCVSIKYFSDLLSLANSFLSSCSNKCWERDSKISKHDSEIVNSPFISANFLLHDLKLCYWCLYYNYYVFLLNCPFDHYKVSSFILGFVMKSVLSYINPTTLTFVCLRLHGISFSFYHLLSTCLWFYI